MTRNGTRAFTTTSSGILIVDIAQGEVVGEIETGQRDAVALDPTETKAYVVNGPGAEVVVIDTMTNTVAKRIPVGSEPFASSQFIWPAGDGQPVAPTLSPTASSTPTDGFPTYTLTPTVTSSRTPTLSRSVTPAPTLSPSSTSTPPPSPTPTPTATSLTTETPTATRGRRSGGCVMSSSGSMGSSTGGWVAALWLLVARRRRSRLEGSAMAAPPRSFSGDSRSQRRG